MSVVAAEKNADLFDTIQALGQSAKAASAVLANAKPTDKNQAIRAAAEIFACSAAMAGAVLLLPLDGFTPGFFTLTIKASVGITVYLIACWLMNASDCRHVIADIRGKLMKSALSR